jgi:uncharacterized protein YkwD
MPLPAAAQAFPPLDQLRSHALERLNEDRRAAGLKPLDRLADLDASAQRLADDMASRGYVAHETPEGQTPEARLASAGVHWRKFAENIASCEDCGGVPDLAAVDRFETMWMASPQHRANILDPELTHVGYGIAAGADGRQYAVADFALPDDGQRSAR